MTKALSATLVLSLASSLQAPPSPRFVVHEFAYQAAAPEWPPYITVDWATVSLRDHFEFTIPGTGYPLSAVFLEFIPRMGVSVDVQNRSFQPMEVYTTIEPNSYTQLSIEQAESLPYLAWHECESPVVTIPKRLGWGEVKCEDGEYRLEWVTDEPTVAQFEVGTTLFVDVHGTYAVRWCCGAILFETNPWAEGVLRVTVVPE